MRRARRAWIVLGSLAVSLGALVSCRSWKGTDLGAGHECGLGSSKSSCAKGLFCDGPLTGRIEHEGDDYFVRGTCVAQRTAGQRCLHAEECASARCERPPTAATTLGSLLVDPTAPPTPGVCAP